MAKRRRVGLWVGGAVLVALGAIAFLVGPEALTAYRYGFFSQENKLTYTGDSKGNLRRIHTALMLYHDSEGQFPIAEGWMNAIENRLQTNDLKPGEGIRKLRNPMLPPDEAVYGYAMNEAASGKYKDDVPGGDKLPLIFDSSDTSKNAHGDPKSLAPAPARSGGNLSITIGGELITN